LDELKTSKKCDLLDLVKIRIVHLEAKAEREGVNPFTGETMMFSARPSRYKAKATISVRLKKFLENT